MIQVFDLDGTLFTDNSGFSFGKWLFQTKRLPFFPMSWLVLEYALHKSVGLSMHTLHMRGKQRFLSLFTHEELSQLAKQYTEKFWKHSLYTPAYERLINAHQAGHFTLLLSSGPSFLIEHIAQALEVSAWHATEWNHTQGVYVVDGHAKREILATYVNKMCVPPAKITAYSDSHLDLPLFQYVGHPIGVRPDKTLRKICMTNNWEIL